MNPVDFWPSTQNQISIKKFIFGVDKEKEISKLVYGFFLDTQLMQIKVRLLGKNNSLSKYEFFAGSITSDRLNKELRAFLRSSLSNPLSHNTRKVIEEYIELLELSQELSDEIDLLRSSQWRLAFLAASGQGSEAANHPLQVDASLFAKLTQLALEKVQSLEAGEKAIFLMGSILHETLLFVEKVDNSSFNVRYHDSADRLYFYQCGVKELLEESFWNTMYSLKFSTNPSLVQTLVGKHFQEQRKDKQNCPYTIRHQHANTCHLRCHLSVLKYEIMSAHPAQDTGYIEWNLVKETFGQFLLGNPHLKDEDLRYFSEQQQAKRSKTTQNILSFHDCIQKGRAKETLEIYAQIMNRFSGHTEDPTFDAKTTYDQIKVLSEAEKHLFKILEESVLSPEDVVSIFNEFDNPWIKNTFEAFKTRFAERQKEFHTELQAELELVNSEFLLFFKQLSCKACDYIDSLPDAAGLSSFLGTPQGFFKTVQFVPMEEKKVCELLTLFESHPEWLSVFNQTPCFQSVLLHGISLGYAEQVMRISQSLSPKDRQTFHLWCREILQKNHALKNLEAVKTFIKKNPNSTLAKELFVIVSNRMLRDKEFSKFLEFVNHSDDSMPICDIDVAYFDIPEEKIFDFLSTLQSLHEEMQEKTRKIYFLQECLNGIFRALEKNITLCEKASTFNIPELEGMLDQLKLAALCQKGLIQEIRKLPIEKRKVSLPETHKYVIEFNPTNYGEGLDLLKDTCCPNFAIVIFYGLFTAACREKDQQLAGTILETFLQNAKNRHFTNVVWSTLGYEGLLPLSKFVIETQERWADYFDERFNILRLVSLLASSLPLDKFLEARTVLDSVDPGALLDANPSLEYIINELHPSDQTPLARMIRFRKCTSFMPSLYNGYGISEENFLDNLHLVLSNSDFSNPKTAYEEIIKPIFRPKNSIKNESKVLSLIQRIKAPEIVFLLIGVVFLEKGHEAIAQGIVPDLKKLKEMSEIILSK